MANITATYPQGASTTKVSPGVASPMTPDMTARLQLDALIGQERQTGYRSVKPMYLPMPTQRDYSTPQNHAAPTYAPHGMGVAPPPVVHAPEKNITHVQQTPYGDYYYDTVNPEFEQWAAEHGQFDVGPDSTSFANSPIPGSSSAGYQTNAMALPDYLGTKAPSQADQYGQGWYDMPEWRRTQILSQQLYGQYQPNTPPPHVSGANAAPPPPPYWLARP